MPRACTLLSIACCAFHFEWERPLSADHHLAFNTTDLHGTFSERLPSAHDAAKTCNPSPLGPTSFALGRRCSTARTEVAVFCFGSRWRARRTLPLGDFGDGEFEVVVAVFAVGKGQDPSGDASDDAAGTQRRRRVVSGSSFYEVRNSVKGPARPPRKGRADSGSPDTLGSNQEAAEAAEAEGPFGVGGDL